MVNKKVLNDLESIFCIKNEDGIYQYKATDIAKHFNLHTNAVYNSRKSRYHCDRLDKLYAYDLAKRFVSEHGLYCLQCNKQILLEKANKVIVDGQEYFVTFHKVIDH